MQQHRGTRLGPDALVQRPRPSTAAILGHRDIAPVCPSDTRVSQSNSAPSTEQSTSGAAYEYSCGGGISGTCEVALSPAHPSRGHTPRTIVYRVCPDGPHSHTHPLILKSPNEAAQLRWACGVWYHLSRAPVNHRRERRASSASPISAFRDSLEAFSWRRLHHDPPNRSPPLP